MKYDDYVFEQLEENQQKIWWEEEDSTCEWAITLKKRAKVNEYKDSITDIISVINAEAIRFYQIRISLVKTSIDTVFIKVNNDEFLTQRLGTTGANVYMGAVTYSLTEGKYNYVFWDFLEGDHAKPGAKNRASIKKEALFCIEE